MIHHLLHVTVLIVAARALTQRHVVECGDADSVKERISAVNHLIFISKA